MEAIRKKTKKDGVFLGILKPYLNRIDDKNYLYIGKISGVTLAKHIQNNLASNNWIPINYYDLKKYIELAKSQ